MLDPIEAYNRLLKAVRRLLDAPHPDHFASRLGDEELAAVEELKSIAFNQSHVQFSSFQPGDSIVCFVENDPDTSKDFHEAIAQAFPDNPCYVVYGTGHVVPELPDMDSILEPVMTTIQGLEDPEKAMTALRAFFSRP